MDQYGHRPPEQPPPQAPGQPPQWPPNMAPGAGPAPAAAPSPVPDRAQIEAAVQQRMRVESQMKSGANWFFWIAGLSLVNTVLLLSGSKWTFIIGLGVTQIVDSFAAGLGQMGIVVALCIDVVIAGVFAGFGVLSRKRQAWACVVGMVLYGLDGLLFLLFQDWLSLGFHAFALYGIFKGLQAMNELRRMEQAAMPVYPGHMGGPPYV